VFFNPRKNRRNDPGHRAAFRAQGGYFRQYDDAGFVADPAELLAVWRAIENSAQQVVAPFHTHRRQPTNFSVIDYRLHNPVFAWHLIISLRNPRHPVLQPFRVDKEPSLDIRVGSGIWITRTKGITDRISAAETPAHRTADRPARGSTRDCSAAPGEAHPGSGLGDGS
jgi:hypothetical protein